jgi:hypothetical protein
MWHEGIRFDIHFRCHQPEEPMFMEIMKREGWDRSMYSMYPGQKENYYNIGNKEDALNGWQNYNQTMNFWSDIVKNESQYTLITGVDGEMFKHIALNYSKHYAKRSENRMLDVFLHNIFGDGLWDGIYMKKFSDVLTPYFGYFYLEKALTVRPEWCKWLGNTDTIRYEMAKQCNYHLADIPYGVHDYSWNLTDNFFKKIREDFANSLFFKTYGKYMIKKPDFVKQYGWDACVWGWMTAYDKIHSQ